MAKGQKDILLGMVRDGAQMSLGQQLRLAILLSLPSIIAQLSSVMMQYIDAGMVGRLGAGPSASIGLITTSTWILNGFVMGGSSGFSVQVAHLCGAKDFRNARKTLKQGLSSVTILGILLSVIGLSLSKVLPFWLGGTAEIAAESSSYFLIFSAFIPLGAVGFVASSCLQASGNMKVPSAMYIGMCVLDVIFNYFFIFVCGMGVTGAALGTGLSELVTSGFAVWYALFRSKELGSRHEDGGGFIPKRKTLENAWSISAPMWLQNIISRGAYVASTVIVAPLGPVAIAANAFAITAESFCYLPGYGISEAATTLTGQTLGAGRKDLTKRFSTITILMGAGIMTFIAFLMYLFSTELMQMLSTDPGVVKLGAKVLRIEAFAETLYACSIVGYGIFVGAGDTLVPSTLNFCSMWIVRIGLAVFLTPRFGLEGYWIAMCIELNVRGLLFLWRLKSGKWMKCRQFRTQEA